PNVVRRLDPHLQTASIQGWNAFHRVATFVGTALAGLGLQITEGEELIAHPEKWAEALEHAAVAQPELREVAAYFRHELPRLPSSLLQAWRAKTVLFQLDPSSAAMFGSSKLGIDWQSVVDERQAVLFDFRDEHDPERIRFKMLWVFTTLMEFIKRRGPG